MLDERISGQMAPSNLVVVGVDGSKPSRNALRYAHSEANRRATTLRVMTAYEPPELWPVAYGAAMPITGEELERLVRAQTQRTVDEELASDPLPPPIEIVVTAGPPAAVLVDASQNADLLVVGNRGRSGLPVFCSARWDCSVFCTQPARAP